MRRRLASLCASISVTLWVLPRVAGGAVGTPPVDVLQSPARAPLSGPPTFAFDCGGETLAVIVIGNHATSLWPARGVTLTRMASAGYDAASPRYSSEAITLQLHADGRASWLEPGRRTRRCTPRPVLALVAHARLRGSTLVALGPGRSWSLEMTPDAQGVARVRFERPVGAEPRPWDAAQSRVSVLPRPCRDARLGAGTRVVAVSVDGVALEGCGREFD